jgi:undecaprenyl diphosphate synthase
MARDELLDWIPAGSPDEARAREVDFNRLPAHIAIIMDGNGRWAAQQHLPRVQGHHAGIAAVRDTVETAARLGIHVLTLYAFSMENWKRPHLEVSTLMALLKRYLKLELKTLISRNIRFGVIGRMEGLSPDVQKQLRKGMDATAGCTGMLIEAGVSPAGVDEETFSRYLYTAGQPDPDLLIRTSGELRISNFLLWQIAYAEIWVTDVLWPDFRRQHLLDAILDFQKRDRRFGGITPHRREGVAP